MTPTRDIVEHEATHVGVVKRLRPDAQLEQVPLDRPCLAVRTGMSSQNDYDTLSVL